MSRLTPNTSEKEQSRQYARLQKDRARRAAATPPPEPPPVFTGTMTDRRNQAAIAAARGALQALRSAADAGESDLRAYAGQPDKAIRHVLAAVAAAHTNALLQVMSALSACSEAHELRLLDAQDANATSVRAAIDRSIRGKA